MRSAKGQPAPIPRTVARTSWLEPVHCITDQAKPFRRSTAPAPSSIAFDLDHFKNVNDRYGHSAGDRAIEAVADCMQRCARPSDVLCRVGGEELLMILPWVGAEDAIQVAERLRETVRSHRLSFPYAITVSAGVRHYQAWEGDTHAAIRQV